MRQKKPTALSKGTARSLFTFKYDFTFFNIRSLFSAFDLVQIGISVYRNDNLCLSDQPLQKIVYSS